MEKTLKNSSSDKKIVYGLMHLTMLMLSVLLVLVISVDTFNKDTLFYEQPGYLHLQFWICLLFLVGFVVEMLMSERKCHYLATHFIFLLVAIPYHNIFAWLGWTASPEVAYIVRFAPLLRGLYAMGIIVSWFVMNRISGLFITYLLTLLSSIYFGGLIFFMAEHESNALVHGFSDAIWWAFMDATTVGSNIIAVTPTGKVLSVLLAAVGMMMFPIFTVYITNLIEKKK